MNISPEKNTFRAPLIASITILVFTVIALLAMGRVPICTCGFVKFWHGTTMSSENSQHFSDWYSFSHVIHGFIFYWVTWLMAKIWPISLGWRAVIALFIEGVWEIIENTPLIIDRYREITISLDYYGDSILNSGADIGFMLVGFFLASRLPVWLTIVIALTLEAFTAVMIRDNLTLNILMLLYPLDAVREWQLSG